MLKITPTYFEETNISSKYNDINYLLETEKTIKLCKIAKMYAVINNTSSKYGRIKKPLFGITLAQKILSPLTPEEELKDIPLELICHVKNIAQSLKLLKFPEWFSNMDIKKLVKLNIVCKDTLKKSTIWCYIPFTKLNALKDCRCYLETFVLEIFLATFSNYIPRVKVISKQSQLDDTDYLKKFLIIVAGNPGSLLAPNPSGK